MILVPRFRIAINLVGAVALMIHPGLPTADLGAQFISPTSPPLPASQVVDNLVLKNQERAQMLRHSETTRVYHIVYRGFPRNREAQMIVEATYDSPSTKQFKIVSQSGSKLLLKRVLKRLLRSEQEAAQPAMRAQTELNRANYEFALLGFEPSETGQYVFWVSPKSTNRYVYRGKVWVDGTDFAVTRIEAEPIQNPSFWTKKIEIRVEYKKMRSFWLPARNESVSNIRLGGRATLTIEYQDYHLSEDGQVAKPTGISSP